MSQKYLLCNDGTRIYVQIGASTAPAICEQHGAVCTDTDHYGAERVMNNHARDSHGGKHSMT